MLKFYFCWILLFFSWYLVLVFNSSFFWLLLYNNSILFDIFDDILWCRWILSCFNWVIWIWVQWFSNRWLIVFRCLLTILVHNGLFYFWQLYGLYFRFLLFFWEFNCNLASAINIAPIETTNSFEWVTYLYQIKYHCLLFLQIISADRYWNIYYYNV